MQFSNPLDALRRVLAFLRGSTHSAHSRCSGGPHQVAALPVKVSRSGKLKVLLISTRGSSEKLIIPRGWPMKGKADFQAAAIEAQDEAGVLGPVTLNPVGSYEYQSARKVAGLPIRVDVYWLDVRRHAPELKEKGERRLVWLGVEEAVRQVEEPGLVLIIQALERRS